MPLPHGMGVELHGVSLKEIKTVSAQKKNSLTDASSSAPAPDHPNSEATGTPVRRRQTQEPWGVLQR